MSEKFFDRDLSWLQFNGRVLAEGMDASNPLLERLKFLGIVSSNFDEFFMVRVASLSGEERLKPIYTKAYEIMEEQQSYFMNALVPELAKAGIERVQPQGLNERQMEYIRSLYQRELLPLLTPIAIHAGKPVPILANLAIYMAVRLSAPGIQDPQTAVVEIPKNVSRMISLPSEKGYQFILLEDVVALFAKELFAGYEIAEEGFFRITRAAELSIDEEKDEDFAKVMAEAIRERRHNYIVLIETALSKDLWKFLSEQLQIPGMKNFPRSSWFDLKSISQLAFQPAFEDLKRPAWIPKTHPDFEEADDVWSAIREKDILVHHPYDSFDAVSQFVAAAAEDPDVLAIKQTLYRAGNRSSIIASLAKAAEKGKQVTVLVELKARFDEENNIQWARWLESVGASVLYGVAGLKTHAKVCLVVRREPEGIRRYVHLSTGNYNEKTAQIYSDIGLFTCKEGIAQEVSSFFNVITGFSQPVGLHKLDIAPYSLRGKLKRLIHRETLQSTKENPGLIMVKMNSLVDSEMIEALYAASKAGVKIRLNIRGICCLRPGLKGISENIEVVSLVDMFLEHSRIFYFKNAGAEEVYLSSADWMPRNLDRRIELMFPIEDKKLAAAVLDVLKMNFEDNQKSWQLQLNGDYKRIDHGTSKKIRLQEYFCKKAAEREAGKKKLAVMKEIKPQKPKNPPVIAPRSEYHVKIVPPGS